MPKRGEDEALKNESQPEAQSEEPEEISEEEPPPPTEPRDTPKPKSPPPNWLCIVPFVHQVRVTKVLQVPNVC